MNNDLLKYISEYFNTFNSKDYTIYVDGTPAEQCGLNAYADYVVWTIPSYNSDSNWGAIEVSEIEAIKLTPTMMEIVKTSGKVYMFAAKLKTKEKKAKEIILRAKTAIHTHLFNDALKYLDELEALMDK